MANYYGKDRASTLSIQELRLFALSENVLKRGKYEENIANWEKYFGTDRICYLFDEIATDPQGQLEKICHYLKIDPEKLPVEKKSKEKINKALSGFSRRYKR